MEDRLDRLNKTFDAMSDEELQQEIAPGKNRIFYLLGHLAAVHDRMLPLLGLGIRLHVELDQDFLTNPDRAMPIGFRPPRFVRRGPRSMTR